MLCRHSHRPRFVRAGFSKAPQVRLNRPPQVRRSDPGHCRHCLASRDGRLIIPRTPNGRSGTALLAASPLCRLVGPGPADGAPPRPEVDEVTAQMAVAETRTGAGSHGTGRRAASEDGSGLVTCHTPPLTTHTSFHPQAPPSHSTRSRSASTPQRPAAHQPGEAARRGRQRLPHERGGQDDRGRQVRRGGVCSIPQPCVGPPAIPPDRAAVHVSGSSRASAPLSPTRSAACA